jgi:TolB-like protein/class 3 adenylate cyclase/Tfp pilus assembly protein PilF
MIRRLAAILAADVAGYSRLMHADEERTHIRFTAIMAVVIEPAIAQHAGRFVKSTGDGFLAEFPSAVEAVNCAAQFQTEIALDGAGESEDRRFAFRIGIHLGDVIVEERDIYGDGVNVAARLEALAEPGGIVVSDVVHENVRGRLPCAFEDMGDQTVKNIARPVRTYRVRFEGPEQTVRMTLRPARRRNVVTASIAGLAAIATIVGIAVGIWHTRSPQPSPKLPVAAAERVSVPLPDKPSVAVLPFTSIGGDAKQERLADGITEDVITDLSRFRQLVVIASHTMFTYKGKAVNVADIGRELGVRYVLEGSIQTNGDRIRVSAQLIEAATDTHLWSERYQRPLDDIFEVQIEIAQKITATLGEINGVVTQAEAAKARRKTPANLEAYDYWALGTELQATESKENTAKAEELFKKALELDPQLARAYRGLAGVYNVRGIEGWGPDDPAVSFQKAKTMFMKAIALDPTDSNPHRALGEAHCFLGEFDRCLAEFDEALTLNPNDPTTLALYGDWLTFFGRAREGEEMVNRAFRLNPHYPDWYNDLVEPFYATGQYDEVIARILRHKGQPIVWNQIVLAMSYAQLGRQKDAAAAKAELLRRYPDFSLERAMSDLTGGPIRDQPTLEHYMNGARKAGLNDCAKRSCRNTRRRRTSPSATPGGRRTRPRSSGYRSLSDAAKLVRPHPRHANGFARASRVACLTIIEGRISALACLACPRRSAGATFIWRGRSSAPTCRRLLQPAEAASRSRPTLS